MIVSIFVSLTINKTVSSGIRQKWIIITGLMVFFLIGYTGFLFFQFQNFHKYLELITGIVFFGGALFVLLVMLLIKTTLILTKKATHSLEEKVIEHKRVSEELRKAISEIKTLRGIIPICMYCHKIKAEMGDWNKLETYIEEHSTADFTHGICPDCLKKQLEEVKEIKGD